MMAHPAIVIFVCVAARSKPRPLKKKTPKIIRIIKEKKRMEGEGKKTVSNRMLDFV